MPFRPALVCSLGCFLLLCSSVSAEPPRRVESAPVRWSKQGKGGTPDFVRHVVPLFSKLGCNNRACHGSFQGQSGFRLEFVWF